MGIFEPYFARLGKHVRLNASFTKASWAELANGDGTANRFFAIGLGYFVVGLVVALYLNLLNVGNVQSAGRAIRTAIRQQLIVTKVRDIYDALFPPFLTRYAGCRFHSSGTCHLPTWLRVDVGFLLYSLVSGYHHRGSRRILCICTTHGNLLSLVNWHDVHVSDFTIRSIPRGLKLNGF